MGTQGEDPPRPREGHRGLAGSRWGGLWVPWAPGAPRARAPQSTTSEERGPPWPPPANRNKDQRTQLRSTQTKDEVLTEMEQAEGGERHICYEARLCVPSQVHSPTKR